MGIVRRERGDVFEVRRRARCVDIVVGLLDHLLAVNTISVGMVITAIRCSEKGECHFFMYLNNVHNL